MLCTNSYQALAPELSFYNCRDSMTAAFNCKRQPNFCLDYGIRYSCAVSALTHCSLKDKGVTAPLVNVHNHHSFSKKKVERCVQSENSGILNVLAPICLSADLTINLILSQVL